MTTSGANLGDALITALHQPGREHLLDLVRNPLRLTLLCFTWNGSSLPDTRSQLYENYLREVYTWNQNLQELRKQAQRCNTTVTELKQRLNRHLGELAKVALDLPQERFRLSEKLVEKYLGEEIDETSLCYLALRLNWLNRVGRDERGRSVFAFYHTTFQEYFAALAVEKKDWNYFLPKRIFEPQWKQVILLWLGREYIGAEEKEAKEAKEAFIRALVEVKDGCGEWNFETVDRGFYEYRAYFLAAAGINEFKACSRAAEIVRQVVKWGFGEFDSQKQKWGTFLDPISEGARNAIPETIRQLATPKLIDLIDHCSHNFFRSPAILLLQKIAPENDKVRNWVTIRLPNGNKDNWLQAADSLDASNTVNEQLIADLLEVLATTDSKYTRLDEVLLLEKINPGISQPISALVKILANTYDKDICWMTLEKIGHRNPQSISGLQKIIAITESEDIRWRAAASLGRIDPGNRDAIDVLLEVLRTTKNEKTRMWAAQSLGEINPGNPEAIDVLVKLIETTEDEDTRWRSALSLPKILTTTQQYAEVVTALKHNLCSEVYHNNFDRFYQCYKLIWNCAENLPYPEFYQAWHPEVTEQTPHSGEPSFASPLTCESLQHLPMYCLKANPLADETDPSEIAKTLCRLIWKQALPNQRYPKPSTPADLCGELDELKFTLNPPKLAILLTNCEHPTPELIAFCRKLTDTVAVAFLTDAPLEAPLKGFPPNQPNLLSAIETWLEEI
ncbi:HEAT repeat domain-containing protein [[Phormidium] sp. ETS-05]|uniref:NACHT C-terminal alpha/beta 1 domain-containing protein n=1 Tax=[Phormidium] sp. ETS-05 TaxID=222819 RepID=UPI0018EF14A5|nr:HEAT repeat domain-containing protein [[Phormidium] sp. ETS-05]